MDGWMNRWMDESMDRHDDRNSPPVHKRTRIEGTAGVFPLQHQRSAPAVDGARRLQRLQSDRNLPPARAKDNNRLRHERRRQHDAQQRSRDDGDHEEDG